MGIKDQLFKLKATLKDHLSPEFPVWLAERVIVTASSPDSFPPSSCKNAKHSLVNFHINFSCMVCFLENLTWNIIKLNDIPKASDIKKDLIIAELDVSIYLRKHEFNEQY